MIRSVTIKGFRSIDRMDSLELGQINVFIGANGAGKSNILEAIGVLGAAAEGEVNDTELLRRGVRPGVPKLFKTSMRNMERRGAIELAAEWVDQTESARYSARIDNSEDAPERAWCFRHEKLSRDGERIVGRSPATRPQPDQHTGVAARCRATAAAAGAPAKLLEALVEYAIYTPTTAILRGLEADPMQREPVGLSGGRIASGLRELFPILRKNADTTDELFSLLDWVSRFALRQTAEGLLSPEVPAVRDLLVLEDRRMKRNANELTAYDASEGVLYVLFLALLALHPRMSSIFAVDNFDAAMHPRLCRAATRFLVDRLLESSTRRQVLLTTHNPLALDGLDLRNDEIRLFAVERDKLGATACKRVVLDERVLDSDNPDRALSQLWVMGYLGGVPEVW